MKELKPYIVEFDKNGVIKPKAYPQDCAIGSHHWQPIMVITHNEYTFSANDGIQKS